MRVPGQDLPFSEADLLVWWERQFPRGAASCPYCRVAIDAFNASPDHRVPISRGGDLSLDNLEAVCQGCNRLKGALLPNEFRDLWEWISGLHPVAQQDVIGRLKAGAMGMRLRFYKKS